MRPARLPALSVFSALLAACAGDAPPPDARPDPAAPPQIEEDAWFASYTATRVFDVPRDVFAAWWADDGMLGALVETEGLAPLVETGLVEGTGWPQTGARRWARQGNGHWLEERVLAADEDGFRYQVWGYTDPAAAQVAYALGSFEIEAAGEDATRLTWTYRYRPKSRIARPFLDRFVQTRFAAFMEAGMDEAGRQLDAASA